MNERTEVWLRFIGYKLAEVVGAGVLSIGSYFIGRLMNSWLPKENQVTGWFIWWLTGFFGLIVTVAIVGVGVVWIMKNWELANEHTIERRRIIQQKKRKR